MSTWNNKRHGETGKGDKVREGLDKNKFGENLDKIHNSNKPWKSCGGCKNYQNGFDPIGNTLCDKRNDFNLNDKGGFCQLWEDINEETQTWS